MSNVLARSAREKVKANKMADIEEEILLQANLFLLFVLKRRQRQLQNRRKHRFWIRKYSIKFLTDFFPTVRLFVCLCNSYYYGCKRTHTAQLCAMPVMLKANERCYKRTFGLYGLEALNHRSELKILWDTFRSQIAEL